MPGQRVFQSLPMNAPEERYRSLAALTIVQVLVAPRAMPLQ